MNGMMIGVRLDGTKVGNERTNERQFHKLIFNWRFGFWCHEQSEMV